MKSTKSIIIALLVPMLVIFSGCRSENIRNVESQPLISSSESVKLDNVTKAIQRAGASLGWAMRVMKPGHIEGTLNLRKHMAKVDIMYDAKNYSIKYKDSAELGYDGTQIHKNYNSWISNLNSNIQKQMALL